jgi:glycosyltransferase involved in cell wall biosynthesis
MRSKILLSVALITKNRPASLRRTLASLRGQNVQPFEVIISDDSNRDNAPAIEALAHSFNCGYSRGPGRGLYANRNAAATICRGTHIRTMDDDHLLPPGHLAACLVAIREDPLAIWTTGEYGLIEGRLVAHAMAAIQLGPAGVGESVKNVDDNWGIADGSTIYPREVFDRGFRMVEAFRFGTSYLEFGAFLYHHGWKCRCIPGAAIEHHVSELSVPDPLSVRFASICYNRYFRPNAFRLVRHLAPHVASWTKLPDLFRMAGRRWERH